MFAQNTQDAVIRFQQTNGLVADGIAGPRTLGVLYGSNALSASTDRTVTSAPVESTPPFNPGPVVDTGSGVVRQAEAVTDDGGDILVFSGPGTQYDQLLPIPSGTIVSVTDRTDGFWVQLADGGWIYSGRLRF